MVSRSLGEADCDPEAGLCTISSQSVHRTGHHIPKPHALHLYLGNLIRSVQLHIYAITTL